MELQWNQTGCAYLRRDLRETENLEQLQEVRLPDGMPDVGRVLCAWGQPVLRSKEWRNDAVAVSGGVNAWVLYAPEDNAEPKCMEVWLPFQAKWNLPGSRREGVMRVSCCLRSVDARTLSSRKIMVRASVGVMMEAMEPDEQPVYREGELPEGVQLLQKTYPVMLPKEAGEKMFTLEEDILPPGDRPVKILCCQVYPEITEPGVIGGRAVFRGNCKVQTLYMTESGTIGRHIAQFPFAQYAELDRDYDKEAELTVMMAVSTLEPDITENGIHIKCGLIAQYIILDRQLLQVAEDAYSPWQEVKPMVENLELPMILDRPVQMLKAGGQMQVEGGRVVDVTFFPDQPTQFRDENGIQSQMGGYFQVLYRDSQGQLQCSTEHWSGEWSIPMEESGQAFIHINGIQPVQQGDGADSIYWETDVAMETMSVSGQPITMITGLQMGEKTELDPSRPSLILRRMGEDTLWNLAKRCGSTVEAIRKANQLTGEPATGQMLLIPVT